MKLVSYWRTATKRNSVRVMIIHFVLALIAGTWSALPGAFVDRFPHWAVWAVSAFLAALGLLGAYTKQSSLEEPHVDAE
jgi:hypothetical protein